MSTTEPLLPCPFCGGEATLHPGNSDTDKCVSCDDCEVVTDHYTREEAIAAWNRRATPPAPAPEGWVDALKSAEKALRPFFNAVFNDNGDMTVHGGYRYNEAVAGYWAYKRVRDAISAAPAAPTEGRDE